MNGTTSSPPNHTAGKATGGLNRVYVVVICLVEVEKSPLADPLLPHVLPDPDLAQIAPNPAPP